MRPAAILLAAALGCAAAPAPTPPGPSGRSDAPDASRAEPVEDAMAGYWDEREVDVPARPVDPIHPAYPPELRALGREGDVEARVAVRADGSVGGARLVASSDEAFAAAAQAALRAARFHPARRAGQPVSSWVTVRLRFRLAE